MSGLLQTCIGLKLANLAIYYSENLAKSRYHNSVIVGWRQIFVITVRSNVTKKILSYPCDPISPKHFCFNCAIHCHQKPFCHNYEIQFNGKHFDLFYFTKSCFFNKKYFDVCLLCFCVCSLYTQEADGVSLESVVSNVEC